MDLLTPAEVEMIRKYAQLVVEYEDTVFDHAPASYNVARRELAQMTLRLVESYSYLVEERDTYRREKQHGEDSVTI